MSNPCDTGMCNVSKCSNADNCCDPIPPSLKGKEATVTQSKVRVFCVGKIKGGKLISLKGQVR